MTTVKPNNAAIERFLTEFDGPVGRDLRRRGENVREAAVVNASGLIIGIKTRNLLDFLGPAKVVKDADGLHVEIGTTATDKDGFSYPAFHDIEGAGAPHGGKRPWLTSALRDHFDS